MRTQSVDPESGRKAQKDHAQQNLAASEMHAAVLSDRPKPRAHLHLRDRDVPFWDDIIRSRSRDEWSCIEANMAAELASLQADIATWNKMIATGDEEGLTAEGFKNLKETRTMLDSWSRRQLALMRSLKIIGGQTGDSKTFLAHRRAERKAEETLERLRDGVPLHEDPDPDAGYVEPPLIAM